MDDVTAERWLPIPEYEGFYEASDLGRVRSLDRLEPVDVPGRRPFTRRRRGRVLRPGLGKGRRAYRKVRLNRDGVVADYGVHTLVLLAFVGACPEGMECRHLNDIKTDNRLANLAWGTKAENAQDKNRNGRNFNLNKTHCPSNHEYTPENTRVRANDWRDCRRCHAEQERERRQRANVA